MREHGDDAGALRSRTLSLGDVEWRALLERAAAETVRLHRPVSVSEVARKILRQATQDGHAA
jgi:hypothetical protein